MQAIKTTYHGPTDTNGSRIRAASEGGDSITIGYPHEARDGADAHALCRKLGWDGTLIAGALKDGYAFVFLEGSDTYVVNLTEEERESARTIRTKRIDAIMARS